MRRLPYHRRLQFGFRCIDLGGQSGYVSHVRTFLQALANAGNRGPGLIGLGAAVGQSRRDEIDFHDEVVVFASEERQPFVRGASGVLSHGHVAVRCQQVDRAVGLGAPEGHARARSVRKCGGRGIGGWPRRSRGATQGGRGRNGRLRARRSLVVSRHVHVSL